MKLFVLTILFPTIIQAQITITSSDFINGQDTALISVVSNFQNINFSNTGANYNWDFTNVIVDSQRVENFYQVSSANFIYQFSFNNPFNPNYKANYYKPIENIIPTTGLPISVENPISFDKISSSSFKRVGLGANINNLPIPIVYDSIDLVYQLPMTYMNNWQSNSSFLIDLNPGLNAKFKRKQNRSSVVDGYGTITTLYGTFDVVRVKSSLNFTDSVFYDIFGTGASWLGLPTASEIEYTWWAKNNKIPIFYIKTINGFLGETINKVEFRDDIDYTSIDQPEDTKMAIYPNPTKNSFKITFPNNSLKTITVYNNVGQVIFNETITTSLTTINSNSWTSGVYYITVSEEKKTSTQKIIIQ